MKTTIAIDASTKRFPIGQLYITLGASDLLTTKGHDPLEFLHRHAALERGVLCEDDHQQNLQSLKDGSQIHSAFLTRDGKKVWVITEADRSVTTILLPDEY